MLYSNSCYLKETCNKYKEHRCEKDSFCMRLFKQDAIFNLSGIDINQRSYMNLRIDSDGTDRLKFQQLSVIQDNIEDFVRSGKNLYLFSSNCGNGKTSWALRLAQTYIDKIWISSDISCRVLFVNVPEYFFRLKDSFNQSSDYIDNMKKYVYDCDIVIWDDIGTKVGSTFEVENLLSIVDKRLRANKSNIYTSNMMPEQLQQRLGERLYSRIWNMSERIQLDGQDKRGL